MDATAYRAYCSVIESPTLRVIWARAYGQRFWDEVEPPWTLATIDDVQFVVHALHGQSARLVDLGCGSGCLTRRLVRALRAQVVGIDMNPMAARAAQDRSVGPEYADKVEFKTGDIANTGFADEDFDGAASLDVLLCAGQDQSTLRDKSDTQARICFCRHDIRAARAKPCSRR